MTPNPSIEEWMRKIEYKLGKIETTLALHSKLIFTLLSLVIALVLKTAIWG